jgi:hypothetical protein
MPHASGVPTAPVRARVLSQYVYAFALAPAAVVRREADVHQARRAVAALDAAVDGEAPGDSAPHGGSQGESHASGSAGASWPCALRRSISAFQRPFRVA